MRNNAKQLIDMALAEDIYTSDITTDAIIDKKLCAVGKIVAKQKLILAGIDIAGQVFKSIEPTILWNPKKQDGSSCEKDEILAAINGKVHTLLSGERTALNFLQHLSGIATFANKFANLVKDYDVKILDTRKTIPGFRLLEKHAVKMGGGTNHRIGLFDHFLIKNNHISVASSVSHALELAKKAKKENQLIEIETRTMDEIKEALQGEADIIMLDNMSVEQVKEAVKLIGTKAKTEVSGNISLENVKAYAATGVDYISIGAITHSAPAADINMLIEIV